MDRVATTYQTSDLKISRRQHEPDPVAADALVLIKRMKQHVATGCTHCREVLSLKDTEK